MRTSRYTHQGQLQDDCKLNSEVIPLFYNGTMEHITGNQTLKWDNITKGSGNAYTELEYVKNHYKFDEGKMRKTVLIQCRRYQRRYICPCI